MKYRITSNFNLKKLHANRIKMKLFQLLQKNFEFLGFSQNLHPFNQRQLILYFEGVLILVSFVLFMFFIANSVKEFMNSFYLITAAIITIISFTSTVLKAPILFHFFDFIEQSVNSSKCIFKKKKQKVHNVKELH